MGFLRFLSLEFMPGFKHFRKNSLEAPHGCQKSILADGLQLHDLIQGVGGEACTACHGPDASQHSHCPSAPASAAGSPCPARKALPEKLYWHVAIDLAKCCCKRSLTAWSVMRMKLRFIEVPLLKS